MKNEKYFYFKSESLELENSNKFCIFNKIIIEHI